MIKTINTWSKKHVFESQQEHHTIKLDGSKEHGFSPKALLLSGLGSCSGIDVVDILGKMKVPFSSLVIETEASQTNEHPRVFKEVLVTYRIKTAAANEDKVRKAIELSLDKYCGVAAMLKKNSPVHYNLVIE